MILKNWKFWLVILILIIMVIWFKFGGQTYEFIGLRPLYEQRTPTPSPPPTSQEPTTVSNVSNVSRLVTDVPTDRRSKGEQICCQVMEKIYGKPFKSVRPKWLKNPETGANLELDCYNDELKIAVEYNGSQHYKYPNSFHSTKDKFIAQLRRDKYKFNTCEKLGIYIIRVPYTVPIAKIEEYLRQRLPDKSDGNVCQRMGH